METATPWNIDGGFIMSDYSNYNIEELEEMSKIAFSEYYRLATIPCCGQPTKAELDQLQKATEKYEKIREEMARRLGIDA